MLVNRAHRLPDGWEEGLDLVEEPSLLRDDPVRVERAAYEAYRGLRRELAQEGVKVELDTCYRSVADQQEVLDEYTREYGAGYARRYVAIPGYSEHQTGLAVDFTDDYNYNTFYDIFEDDYMKDTDLYRWLVDNCTDYGFVLRYPEGKESFYGVACNHPAHFRYVGKEAAKYMKEHDLCLEEFIMLYDESKVYLPQP